MIRIDTAGEKKKNGPAGAATRDEGEIKIREYCSSPNIHSTHTPRRAPRPAAFKVPGVPNSGIDAMARLRKLKQIKDVLHPDIYKKVEAEIMATVCCHQTTSDVQDNLSNGLLTHTVSFDTDEEEEEEKVSGTIPATGDEGVPPAPVVAFVAAPMPNSGVKDATTARMHKLEQMRDNFHPGIYEKVKAEIMATV